MLSRPLPVLDKSRPIHVSFKYACGVRCLTFLPRRQGMDTCNPGPCREALSALYRSTNDSKNMRARTT